MYVKVYISIKTLQKGKIANRLVKTVVKEFPKDTPKQDILDYFTNYHRDRKQHVSSCTGLGLGDAKILWEGNTLDYFIRVTVGGVITEEGLVKDTVTLPQERRLEEQLKQLEYI